jgi:transcriptional regulator with XRE-family HTH domain
MATLGKTLRATRERRGWTREALAYHSGMSAAAIAQIEAGRRKDIRLSSLSALAEALGVTVDHLIGARTGSVSSLEHVALLYGSEEEFLARATPFVREGVENEECPLVVTTTDRIARLRQALADHSDGVEFVDSASWYSTPGSALNGYRDAIHRRRSDGFVWMRILGEPVWAGTSEEDIRRWIRYEAMLNLALAAEPVTLMCPYDTRTVPEHVIHAAHQTHPTVAQPSGPVASAAYRDPEDLLVEIDD